jgi:catechol 2,3-dioxygenase-like lactoylglutathione lyase family enzyme
MENIGVIGTRHIGIICQNLNISLFFYKDILGLSVIQDFWDNSKYIQDITGIGNINVHMIKLKADDGTVIELLSYETHPTDLISHSIINVGICHVALQVNSCERMYDKLVANNFSPISAPILSSEGIAKVFFCLDPNNVRIEFVEMLV